MTDLQILFAVGGAIGLIFGACAAVIAIWWFRPAQLQAAIRPHHQLVAAPRRTPRLRPPHPTRARPHRPAHTSPTGILGDLAATHPELAERLRVRYREAMATPGAPHAA